MRSQQLDAGKKLAWHRACLQTEKVFDLRRRNQDRNSIREPDHHHARDKSDRGAQTGKSHCQQENSGHHRDHGQPAHPEARNDPRDNHYECARWSADLRARSAERGNEETRHNCRVKARLRRDARRNPKGHRQWKRNQPHREPCHQVVDKQLRRVGPEGKDRLRNVRHAYGHQVCFYSTRPKILEGAAP